MGRNCAVILAAGKGSRMGKSINKQYLIIEKYPILYYTIKAFSQSEYQEKRSGTARKWYTRESIWKDNSARAGRRRT